jgi:hypothetical protein
MVSYFEVLGVSASATDQEVSAAYHRLAKEFHPDAHPGASQAERLHYEEAMSRINAAYDALKTQSGRASQATSEAHDPTSRFRSPVSGECDLCGSSPAREFHFEYQTAWIFSARRYSSTLELCRACALAMGRAHQNRTLDTGWYGIFAFFWNFGVVFRNASGLRAAAAMPSPTQHDEVVAPLRGPVAPTPPLLRRGGAWFAAALVAVVIVVIVVFGSKSSDAPLHTNFEVGACVQGTGTVTPVDCSASHSGKIVDSADSPNGCPAAATGYVTDGGTVYCIDDTQ